MRVYAKTLVDKAVNSLGKPLPIPDDRVNDATSRDEIVHL